MSNPFKYTGEVFDDESGLYYLSARYYDPSVGRFINEDSYEGQLNNPLSLNQYTYVQNNPSRYTDSSGHCIWDLCIGEISLGLAIAGALMGAIGAGTTAAIMG
jgi:RHS repeat-associated protein